MTVRRLPPLLLALVLGVLSAVAVACGDDGDGDRKLLSPTRAATIREELDTIAARVERGDCDKLDPAFIRLERAVEGLPRATDRRLRRRLADGVENLRTVAPDDCRGNRPRTTETTETTPETTETLPPETVETVPPETEPTPPPTQTVPPETTPTPPPTTPPDVPPDNGGAEAPESFVPPGQAKKGDKD